MHAHWHLVFLVACGFGVAVIVALAVVYRRASERHAIEEAERILADD